VSLVAHQVIVLVAAAALTMLVVMTLIVWVPKLLTSKSKNFDRQSGTAEIAEVLARLEEIERNRRTDVAKLKKILKEMSPEDRGATDS